MSRADKTGPDSSADELAGADTLTFDGDATFDPPTAAQLALFGAPDLSDTAYRVEGVLGQGAMGVVYRGVHVELDMPVAIKTLHRIGPDIEAQQDRFAEEARALAKLRHPHIVEVTDFGRDPLGRPWFVMPLLSGEPLDEFLERSGPLPFERARQILTEVLEGLEAAHHAGVVHRDVKPSNVLLVDYEGREGHVKLLDFGVALDLGSARTTPQDIVRKVGTPSYLSPEQASGSPQDHRVDVYACAVLLFRMLTGGLPFRGPGARHLLLQHQHDPPPLASDQVSGLPDGIDRVLQKALAKKPGDRYASAQDFARALQRLDEAEPAVARAPTPSPAPARRASEDVSSADRAELDVLADRVERFWIRGFLEREVPEDTGALAPPGVLRFDIVDTPWRDYIGLVDEQDGTVGPDAARVFEELDARMLIVGEGGSGKTVQLLRILRELLSRRASSGSAAVPVLFPLSAWGPDASSARAFVVDQLLVRYQVSPRVARRWLDQGWILPLFDALDEVKADARLRCLRALAEAAREHVFPGLIVTSRLEEYLALDVRLALSGTLHLLPLTDEQIDASLQANPVVARIASAPGVRDFANTPLSLRLILELQNELDDEAGPESLEDRVYEAYVQRVLARSAKRAWTHDVDLRTAIQRLAERMVDNRAYLVEIHDLQPSWLKRESSTQTYAVTSRTPVALFVGLGFVLSMGLSPLVNQGFVSTLDFGVRLGAALGLVGALVYSLDALRDLGQASPPRERPLWLRAVRVLGLSVLIGLPAGVIASPSLHVYPLSVAPSCALWCTLAMGLGRPAHPRWRDIEAPRILGLTPTRLLKTAPWVLAVAGVAMLMMRTYEDSGAAAAIAGSVVAVGLVLFGLIRPAIEEEDRRDRTATWGPAVGTGFVATFFGSWGAFSLGQEVGYSATAALTIATLVATYLGLADFAKHRALRRSLAGPGEIGVDPLDVLEAAADVALVRRVGSAYTFAHRKLLEHCARAPSVSR